MIVLGIDTSMSEVSFALVENSEVLAEFCGDLGRNLVDKISGIFTDLLKKANIKASDIRRCGIVAGPGSFTGLRIGIAFAKGFFADSDVQVKSVSSLECIARSSGKIQKVSVFLDARRNEVFFARFNMQNGFMRIFDEKRISFESAIEMCEKTDDVIYSFSGFSDSALKKIPQFFENSFEVEKLAKNRGEVAAKIAAESENLMTIDDVFPNYMQVSYAERQKDEQK
ncbi:MAG: tRNA (adenosine(37)-N6)-threonylcarbamoyltransferase complex dimerization subunit type 1 TsaB [Chitinispirillales bacterium]|jgi:tRNA threonylcarbamoyl adenosine modification protein YeaZ|nr:tRNA (adenosine(37)-N6)-threonylcarbamoyltransferase complex dimerization subunit type 1 TsaB [Chitinispirillales bacterium]